MDREQHNQIEKLLKDNGLKYSQRDKIIKGLKDILNIINMNVL